MGEIKVLLSSVDDVKNFADAASAQDCDVDILSGRYLVDAKSIMGLFSLDLSRPVCVRIHGTDRQSAAFCAAVEGLVVREGQ